MNFEAGENYSHIETPTDVQRAWGEPLVHVEEQNRGIETATEKALHEELFTSFDDGFGEDTTLLDRDFATIDEIKSDLRSRGYNPDHFDFSNIDENLSE